MRYNTPKKQTLGYMDGVVTRVTGYNFRLKGYNTTQVIYYPHHLKQDVKVLEDAIAGVRVKKYDNGMFVVKSIYSGKTKKQRKHLR